MDLAVANNLLRDMYILLIGLRLLSLPCDSANIEIYKSERVKQEKSERLNVY
jgi:hypothetical protein